MPTCAIINCKNTSKIQNKKNGGVSYFRFPSDPEIKEKWIDLTGHKSDWFPTKFSTICSIHFTDADFTKKKSGNRYLSEDAIPSREVWIGSQTLPPAPSIETVTLQPAFDEPLKRKSQDTLPIHKGSLVKRQKLLIKKLSSQNTRIRRKLHRVEDLIKSYQDISAAREENISALVNENIMVEDLISGQVKKDQSKTIYSPQLRSLALSMHWYDPKGYRCVRETFDSPLPLVRTLRKWYQSIDGRVGFSKETLFTLEHKAKTADYPIYANLSIDIIDIKRHIEWDGKQFYGYVDFGTKMSNDFSAEAKEAIVFLVNCINGKWKVPLGYFLTEGLSGLQRANLVRQCLRLVQQTNVAIASLTCDGSIANIVMLKELGCDVGKSKMMFVHPVSYCTVAVVLDPLHMHRMIKHCFQANQVLLDDKSREIKWNYIEKLDELEEDDFKNLADKLKIKYVHFIYNNNKINWSSQHLSHCVADALKICNEDLKLKEFEGCGATVEFISTINDMFDTFNSKSLSDFKYKQPLSENNKEQISSFIASKVGYLKSIKCASGTLVIESNRKLGFLGFIAWLEGIEFFYENFINVGRLASLPLNKFSLDHVDLLMYNHLSYLGPNTSPTARQFSSAYKKMLTYIRLRCTDSGYRVHFEEISILDCTTPLDRINKTVNTMEKFESETTDDNEEDNEDFAPRLSEFAVQITYVAGFVVYLLVKQLKCDKCVGALVDDEKYPNRQFFVTKNVLVYPSADVIALCKIVETYIKLYIAKDQFKVDKEELASICLRDCVNSNIFDCIKSHQDYPTSMHVTDLLKAIIDKYTDVRMRYLNKRFKINIYVD